MRIADTWIVTGGTKSGVMEMVGEAAREYMLENGLSQQQIVLLGVVAWDMVANRDALQNRDDRQQETVSG